MSDVNQRHTDAILKAISDLASQIHDVNYKIDNLAIRLEQSESDLKAIYERLIPPPVEEEWPC